MTRKMKAMNNISIPENLVELSKQMEGALRKVETTVQSNDKHGIHSGNIFNKRFSVVLGFLSDFQVVLERLHREGRERRAVEIEAKIHESHTEGNKLCDKRQALMQESHRLHRQSSVDLKSLYIFGKIFFDQYVELLEYLIQMERRGISVRTRKGNFSISSLYYALQNYAGNDALVKAIQAALIPKLRALQVYLIEYRDSHVIHPEHGTWAGVWTQTDLSGNTRFLTVRPSSTPLELAFVARNFLNDSSEFLCLHMEEILNGWIPPSPTESTKSIVN